MTSFLSSEATEIVVSKWKFCTLLASFSCSACFSLDGAKCGMNFKGLDWNAVYPFLVYRFYYHANVSEKCSQFKSSCRHKHEMNVSILTHEAHSTHRWCNTSIRKFIPWQMVVSDPADHSWYVWDAEVVASWFVDHQWQRLISCSFSSGMSRQNINTLNYFCPSHVVYQWVPRVAAESWSYSFTVIINRGVMLWLHASCIVCATQSTESMQRSYRNCWAF